MTCPTALDNVYVGVLIIAGSPGEQRRRRTGLFIMTGLARKSGRRGGGGECSAGGSVRHTEDKCDDGVEEHGGANITRRPREAQLLRVAKGCLWKCLPSGCFAVATSHWLHCTTVHTHASFSARSLDKHKAAGAVCMWSTTCPPSTPQHCSLGHVCMQKFFWQSFNGNACAFHQIACFCTNMLINQSRGSNKVHLGMWTRSGRFCWSSS